MNSNGPRWFPFASLGNSGYAEDAFADIDPVEARRKDEIAQYDLAYQQAEYHMGEGRARFVRRYLRLFPLARGSLLDVGTGRGETLVHASAAHFAPVRGTEVVETLIARNPLVDRAEAHALPYDDASWDHVTCFDVLEHLLPEDVAPALREMWRVARSTVTVSASERPSVWGERDLHISKRPRADWEALIAECWGVVPVFVGHAGSSPCWRGEK